MFRIAQESLQNALLHARAARIGVRLDEGRRRLRLTVADDGVGFDPDEAGLRSRRLGLTSMEERARALGGTAADRVRAGPRNDDRPGGGWMAIRVLIADDHAVVRQGLRTFLEAPGRHRGGGDVADGEAALRARRSTSPTWC